MSATIQGRQHRRAVARALDPGTIIDAFVLEVSVQARDPHWREREIYSPPMPADAARALQFVAELGL